MHNPIVRTKPFKLCELNYGPLSETKISGRPCLLKMSRNEVMVAWDVVHAIFTTSGYLLYASTTTR